jgi:amidophosphoribosyltransferase
MGEFLATDQPVEADIVVGVPATGMDAAQGYADASGIRFAARGLFKNDYAGRTFIERGGRRAKVLDDKHRANPVELAGKRVVLVDDSMIKGSTMTRLVNKVRKAGATEVHLRFPGPQFRHPCYAGLDTRQEWRLVASGGKSNEEIATEVGADSVGFGTVERIEQAVREARVDGVAPAVGGLCVSCHTGEYPFNGPTFVGLPEMRLPDSRARAAEVYGST